MVGNAALPVQNQIVHTHNETDCMARSTVTMTAREAGESDATVEANKS
jgi:hypothetical protein